MTQQVYNPLKFLQCMCACITLTMSQDRTIWKVGGEHFLGALTTRIRGRLLMLHCQRNSSQKTTTILHHGQEKEQERRQLHGQNLQDETRLRMPKDCSQLPVSQGRSRPHGTRLEHTKRLQPGQSCHCRC